MRIVNRSRRVDQTLKWTWSALPFGGGSTYQPYFAAGDTKTHFDVTDYREIFTVDPIGQFYHGEYRREYTDWRIPPVITARLRRYYRYHVSNNHMTDINVNGTRTDFGPWRCRFLYKEEESKAQLINNCIKGAMEQSVDLATFISELDKTGDLLADSAKRIASAAGHIRKGQFSRAARTLKIQKPRRASRSKSFSNNLLEYQYGWAPIVQDMAGLAIHIAKQCRDLIVKSRSRTQSSVPLTGGPYQQELFKVGASMDRLLVNWRYASTWTRMEQVELLFRLDSAFWDQVNRLGFLNPGQIAYQNIPGSFLLDWFSNFGDLIADMSRELTLAYVTGSYTQFHRNDGRLWPSPIWWADTKTDHIYTHLQAHAEIGSYTDFKLKRVPITDAEVTTTFFLQAPFSWNRALTATALVRQQLK